MFKERSSVLKELLQNSRRAGATSVAITYDDEERVLRFTDNGHGISDFQKLLSIAESGWDADMVATEHAYGMGFMSALFSGSHVTIESGCSRMGFYTDEALDMADIAVEQTEDHVDGTSITIRGFEMDFDAVNRKIRSEATAMPIEVLFNGEVVERKVWGYHNDPSLFHGTVDGLGLVTINLNRVGSLRAKCFILGQPVATIMDERFFGRSFNEEYIWVELDPKYFMARMPDRSHLHEAEESGKKIKELVAGSLKNELVRLSKAVDAETFCATYINAISAISAWDIFNDLDYIPYTLCPQVCFNGPKDIDRSIQAKTERSFVTKEDLASGRVVLFINGPIEPKDNWWLADIASQKGWRRLSSKLIDAGNWATNYACNMQDPGLCAAVRESFKVTDPKDSFEEYNNFRVDMVACKGVSIRWKNEEIEIVDRPFFIGSADVNSASTIYCPEGMSTYDAARAIKFPSQDLDDDFDEYVSDINKSLRRARGAGFTEELRDAVHNAYLGREGQKDSSIVIMEGRFCRVFELGKEKLKKIYDEIPEVFSESERASLEDFFK